MLQTAPDDEHIPGPEGDRFLPTQVYAERALPTHEQLVFVMPVPGESTLETDQPQDRVVHSCQILGLPGLHERHGSLRDRHGRCHVGAFGMSHSAF